MRLTNIAEDTQGMIEESVQLERPAARQKPAANERTSAAVRRMKRDE